MKHGPCHDRCDRCGRSVGAVLTAAFPGYARGDGSWTRRFAWNPVRT